MFDWGGGILRIAVPDFEAIVREYISSGDLEQVMGLLYGGQDYNYNFHFQAYDFKRMEYLLTEAGFANVVRYEWKDFLPKDFDDFSRAYLPHMDLKKGRLMSLNILAIKQ
jgi:predicted SAM-dependent methyltransferase